MNYTAILSQAEFLYYIKEEVPGTPGNPLGTLWFPIYFSSKAFAYYNDGEQYKSDRQVLSL